ncbi:restriction endonuclease subunit S [Aeribacillus pallidus]|nr:restriction endonuclease subunit S [Aeribacillus pallidus]
MSKKKQKPMEELLEEALVPEEEQPYKVPENWVWVRLGSVISSVKGKKPKELLETKESKSIPYVTIDYLTNGVTEETKYVPEQISKVRCNKEDILMVWDGARSGFVGRGGEGEVGSTLAKIEKRKFDTGYLYYFLKSKYEYINNNHRGTGIPHVNPEVLWNIPFPVSPLNEQKRIAEKIERLFAKIDEAKRLIEEVKGSFELRRAAILDMAFRGELTAGWREQNQRVTSAEEWLENIRNKNGVKTNDSSDEGPYVLPKGWKWIKLSSLGALLRGKSKHRPRNDPRLFGGKYPFIQTGDVANARDYITEYKQTLSDFGFEQSKLFPEGTVCITIAANIADTAILSFPCCFPDSVVGFNAYKESVSPEYIHYYLTTIKTDLEHYAPATAQKNINLKILNEVLVPLPPKEEHDLIIEKIKYLLNKNDVTYNIVPKKESIEFIKNSILSKAFRGELGTNDPTDEHAIDLLKEVLKSK